MTRTLCSCARGGFGGRLRTVSTRKVVSASMAAVAGLRAWLGNGCTVTGGGLVRLLRGANFRGADLGGARLGGLVPSGVGAEKIARDCV
jgi:hypothetical protein